MNKSAEPFDDSKDWRSAYRPELPWAFRRPCGAWFRACGGVTSPRQRLLTMASCRPR
jgi:hypothetical protein